MVFFNLSKEIIELSNAVVNRHDSFFGNVYEEHGDQLKENICGKNILIAGAAGSIGSSTLRKIVDFKPNHLYLLDTNENGLTELIRQIRNSEKDFH